MMYIEFLVQGVISFCMFSFVVVAGFVFFCMDYFTVVFLLVLGSIFQYLGVIGICFKFGYFYRLSGFIG